MSEAESGEGETTLRSGKVDSVTKTLDADANEPARPVDDACVGAKCPTGRVDSGEKGKSELCMKRAEKAEANRRAAMWAAQDRRRGMGWSEEVETASRPVMPVGMSSMRLSPGRLRLGVEGLEGLEAPRLST